MAAKKKADGDVLDAARKHPRAAFATVLCLAGFCLFGLIAEVIRAGGSFGFDRTLMLAMRDPATLAPAGPDWFREVMRDISGLGGVFWLTFVTIATFIGLMAAKKREQALFLLASIGTGILFSSLLKGGFERPRPDIVPHATVVYTSSFPSGHSMMSALTYLTLGVLMAEIQPRQGLKAYIMVLCAALALLIGVSRVYLGVHWPSDVLAGWLAGASWALMVWIIRTRLLRRRRAK